MTRMRVLVGEAEESIEYLPFSISCVYLLCRFCFNCYNNKSDSLINPRFPKKVICKDIVVHLLCCLPHNVYNYRQV